MSNCRLAIAVIGGGDAPTPICELAYRAGREIAARGALLVCGGLGGVMSAAARGAQEQGGLTLGILPSHQRGTANPYIDIAIATGMGEARNLIVVASAAAVIALAGKGGTLAEIGLALKLNRPVVALAAWQEIANLHRADEPETAVALALQLTGFEPGRNT